MAPRINLGGKRFGKLRVLRCAGKNADGVYFWRCICDCGATNSVARNALTSGGTKSCGCMKNAPENHVTHGKTGTPEFRAYHHMIDRCYRETDKSFGDYGQRGIRVCERWRNSFDKFLSDMGEKPSLGHMLERIDNNRNYSPTNCKWATRTEQNRNKRSNVIIECHGEKMCIAEWAEHLGVPRRRFYKMVQWNRRSGISSVKAAIRCLCAKNGHR